MTADREGLTLSSTTLKWFNIVVAVCAVFGPPIAFYTSVKVNEAKQTLIDKRQDEKIAEHQAMMDKTDTKFDKISDDIADVKEVLNQIVGKLNK